MSRMNKLRFPSSILLLLACFARGADKPATLPAPPPLPKAAGAFVVTSSLKTAFANQAAAADDKFIYAISNTQIVKYDRETGKEIARSTGDAHHLNSGYLLDGKIYCAHSNFPKKPDESDIRVLDPATMQLTVFHKFENPPGSLTWCIHKGDGKDWWCHFAHYGKDHGKSVLVRYDENWKELGRWTSPPELVAQWGNYSLSGGIWLGDDLLVTGHSAKAIYRLRVPREGNVLQLVEEIPSPFPGQGLAVDPKTGNLIGLGGKGIQFAKYQSK
jgi:hypothetical protein